MTRRDMADKQKEEFPKVPPFHIVGASGKEVESFTEVPPPPKSPVQKNAYPSERGMLNLSMTLISTISLGIAMLSGAWFTYGILEGDKELDFGPFRLNNRLNSQGKGGQPEELGTGRGFGTTFHNSSSSTSACGQPPKRH